MAEIKTFENINRLCNLARKTFHDQVTNKHREIEDVFSLCFDLVISIGKFKKPNEWKNSREECALSVLIQALETVLAMYYLTESGFWDNALVLKRNFSELLSIGIAIGYENQCFIDWKNGRDSFNSFNKIIKRIEESAQVPSIEKTLLPHLKKYWNESSQLFSHNIKIETIRTVIKDGHIKFEPKVANSEFQEGRLNTLRNMIMNVISVLTGIFKYDSVVRSRKPEFPEAPNLLKKCNECFQNIKWKSEKTN